MKGPVNIKQLRDPNYRQDQHVNNYANANGLILAFHSGHNAATACKNYHDAVSLFTGDNLEAFNVGWDCGSKAK